MADETRFPNPPFVAVGAAGAIAVAPPVVASGSAITKSPAGLSANYALVIQVPLPVISIRGILAAAFSLPDVIPPVIPEALTWLAANAEALFQDVVDVATVLIKAIPEITVSILVKVGPATVVNIQLVAKKVPVNVPLPSFVLSLPNLAIDPSVTLTLPVPIPAPPPIVIEVPVPAPLFTLPPVGVSGGQVSVSTGASANTQAQPVPVSNPVRLPVI